MLGEQAWTAMLVTPRSMPDEPTTSCVVLASGRAAFVPGMPRTISGAGFAAELRGDQLDHYEHNVQPHHGRSAGPAHSAGVPQ
jgi:hypothetical protein